ncbi:MAG: hypothetical protein IKZ91_00965 [Bacteroidales bacterium]|nr:hypothetical protein [Bacteroidales bacterium]
MKRALRLLAVLLLAAGMCSCANFKDIKVTSFDLVSLSPRGLSSIDAALNIGVDNPTVQVTLTDMTATVKMDGTPCLHLDADDVTLSPRTNCVYNLVVHGTIDSGFNPFQLLTLLSSTTGLDPMTVDVRFRGVLRSGLGKDFEYTDIPLKDLMDKL